MLLWRNWSICIKADWGISSVQSLSRVWLLWPHGLQPAKPPCPSPTPRVYSNSCPLCRWCHPTISSSAIPFSSCPQSFPASGSFPMSQLFAWGGQSIGVSASISVLQMNTQDWTPLGWTHWISLQSKGLSRIFSNTKVRTHQFVRTQPSLWSNSHIHTWLLYWNIIFNILNTNIGVYVDGETVEKVADFILGAPKSLQMVTAAMKLKDTSW